MKKIFFATLAVAALALSCQKNEVVVENPNLNQAIEFSTYTGKAPVTKAGVLQDSNFSEFGVTAFYTGKKDWADWRDNTEEGAKLYPNFMYNENVSRTSTDGIWGDWTYSPIKYWPTQTTDQLSFFAYAPYSTNDYVTITEKDEAKSPKITVTIPTYNETDCPNPAYVMVDFVADVQINVKHGVITDDGGSEDTNGDGSRKPVTFFMLHEMTRLALSASLDETLVTANGQASWVVIKSITLGNDTDKYYYPRGTYSFAQENDVVDGETTTYKRGTWDYTGVTAEEFVLNNYLTFTADKTYCADADATPALNGKTYTEKTLGLNTTDKINLMTGIKLAEGGFEADNAFLFLLPPKGEDGLDADQDIVIKYDIVTKDAALKDGYSCTEAEKTVHMPAEFLKQGKAYSLHFTFYVDQVELSASVEEWGDEDNKDIDVPYYPDQATNESL